ncbi:hypothetical protein DFP97_11032 [Paenibacillus prosopidis]|uniref:Uncharacterized protein n=1 Tax=Paenibacillus prosopidis TaxID=630520 RepID=A0A368VTT4_9BACL|nr:hypothetical protein DFP97_11032 [Paenibacillus prosopidis]
MIQVINTIFMGLIISGILNQKTTINSMRAIKIIIILLVCSMYFFLYSLTPNLIMIFGPGACLVIYSYIDYGLKKHLKSEEIFKDQ